MIGGIIGLYASHALFARRPPFIAVQVAATRMRLRRRRPDSCTGCAPRGGVEKRWRLRRGWRVRRPRRKSTCSTCRRGFARPSVESDDCRKPRDPATGLRVPLLIEWRSAPVHKRRPARNRGATASWLLVVCGEASARMSFRRPRRTQPRSDRASLPRSLRQLTALSPGRRRARRRRAVRVRV
jgi:hypothetical protein